MTAFSGQHRSNAMGIPPQGDHCPSGREEAQGMPPGGEPAAVPGVERAVSGGKRGVSILT